MRQQFRVVVKVKIAMLAEMMLGSLTVVLVQADSRVEVSVARIAVQVFGIISVALVLSEREFRIKDAIARFTKATNGAFIR